MQGNWVKTGLIVSIVITCGLVIGFVVETFGGGRSASGASEIWMLCDNPDCQATYSISPGDYRQLVMDMGMGMRPMMLGAIQVMCEKCGQQAAYRGMKCSKCEQAFIPDYSSDYFDKCPSCGYSQTEEYESQ